MKTLSEIRAELERAQGAELERLCGEYEQDARKGVQKLLNQARRREEALRKEMEREGRLKAVVTQNIDGLHQAAGSRTVYELHGSTLRNYCTRCGKFYDVDFIANSTGVPRCTECGGIVKPDVVLYEEGLDEEVLSGAVNAIRHADTLIIGGTSLVVYPAAGLIRYFRGDHLVVINMQPTGADAEADLCIAKPIGQVLSEDVTLDL